MSTDKVVIVENLLHKFVQRQMETFIINNHTDLLWSYKHNANYGGTLNELQFCQHDPEIFPKRFGNLTHTVVDLDGTTSSVYPSLPDFKKVIETKFNVRIKQLVRSRINLTFPIGEVTTKYDTPHCDMFPPKGKSTYKSVVYYINESDGDTVFFDELADDYSSMDSSKKTLIQRISPKQGKAIMFDANRYHAGSFPSLNIRLVLNLNLILEDE